MCRSLWWHTEHSSDREFSGGPQLPYTMARPQEGGSRLLLVCSHHIQPGKPFRPVCLLVTFQEEEDTKARKTPIFGIQGPLPHVSHVTSAMH